MNLLQYRLDFCYVGGAYHGLQSQVCGQTVQDRVEACLEKLLGTPTRIVCSSRTDSGVHARHQVAKFRSKLIDEAKFLRSLDALLPKDIGVLSLRVVSDDFHPMRSVIYKDYVYRILTGPLRDPFEEPYVWHTQHEFDNQKLIYEWSSLIGQHDFKAFCAVDSSAKSTVRTIFSTEIVWHGRLCELKIRGDGFLKQMIRSLVGSAIDRSRGRLSLSLLDLIAQKDRSLIGQTAPAKGLILERIHFKELQVD